MLDRFNVFPEHPQMKSGLFRKPSTKLYNNETKHTQKISMVMKGLLNRHNQIYSDTLTRVKVICCKCVCVSVCVYRSEAYFMFYSHSVSFSASCFCLTFIWTLSCFNHLSPGEPQYNYQIITPQHVQQKTAVRPDNNTCGC